MSADATKHENAANDGAVVAEKLRAARERIARRLDRPELIPPELALPSLDALKEAARAAAQLADGIGAVNPRPPGLINELVQALKRAVARALGWVVRPQRDFNRAVMEAMARSSEILDAANKTTNRNLEAVVESLARSREIHRSTGGELDSLGKEIDAFRWVIDDVRQEIANRDSALAEQFEEKMRLHRWAYDGALARQSTAMQERMYDLLGEIQGQLFEELRVLRQRVAAHGRADIAAVVVSAPSAPAAATAPLGIDYYQ